MRLAWSNLAVDELRELRRYSIERWGREAASRYLADVRSAVRHLAERPDRARPLKGRYRLMRVRSHYLIVHVDDQADQLTIARLLHTAMDVDRYLPPV